VCGRRSIDDLLASCESVEDGPSLAATTLIESADRLSSSQANFPRSGGTHAAAAFAASGELLAAFEDVGRHNAVDKVIGELLYRRVIPQGSGPRPALLTVSGRASFEMIQKAAVARIPVVASISAATSLAIDRTHKSGLYARAGIADYWIVNLPGALLEIYREPARSASAPSGWEYRSVQQLAVGVMVSPLAAPAARIAVADLLPPVQSRGL
jgi:hypothetical protein